MTLSWMKRPHHEGNHRGWVQCALYTRRACACPWHGDNSVRCIATQSPLGGLIICKGHRTGIIKSADYDSAGLKKAGLNGRRLTGFPRFGRMCVSCVCSWSLVDSVLDVDFPLTSSCTVLHHVSELISRHIANQSSCFAILRVWQVTMSLVTWP